MSDRTIVIAGATGDLGARITAALRARGAVVRALLRPDAPRQDAERVQAMGAAVFRADPRDVAALADACRGAVCVVSALNGLREVIVDRQSLLLSATALAGVPRFIPSDYSADFTRTAPGRNRNFDLRREFMRAVDRAPVRATSVLNGAFMDMLGAEMPIIQPRIRRVIHWGDVDQPLDFTTRDDVAAYVACVALDPTAPRILRIAGDTISARGIADVLTRVTGRRYRTLRVGGIGALSVMIRLGQLVAPQSRETFPPWQGMQYLRDMFSGDATLTPLDTARYPGLRWTSVYDHLSNIFRSVVATSRLDTPDRTRA